MDINEREKQLWEKCIEFHGHTCGGIMIGFKAALYAAELLDVGFSKDEEIVCISENDACGVDAVQVVLGCSVGKGNLLFKLRGKQAFNFYDRRTGKAVRLILKDLKGEESKSTLEYLKDKRPEEVFDVSDPVFEMPEKARHFVSVKCEKCGEMTAENMLRLQNGKKLCLDCFKTYERFE